MWDEPVPGRTRTYNQYRYSVEGALTPQFQMYNFLDPHKNISFLNFFNCHLLAVDKNLSRNPSIIQRQHCPSGVALFSNPFVQWRHLKSQSVHLSIESHFDSRSDGAQTKTGYKYYNTFYLKITRNCNVMKNMCYIISPNKDTIEYGNYLKPNSYIVENCTFMLRHCANVNNNNNNWHLYSAYSKVLFKSA